MQTKNPCRQFQKVGAWLLSLVMLVSVLVPMAQAAVTQDQINSLRSQAATLSSQKADLQKKLDKLSNSKNVAVDQKLLLEQKINVLQSEITVSEQSIANYGEMIAQKEVELAEAQKKEAEYYALFCERVRSMEESGDSSYWSVFFNASSFSELLDQVNMVFEIVDYDNYIMDELEKARQAVADAKKSLEENKAAEEAARDTLTAQKADLLTEQQKVERLLIEINSQQATYANSIQSIDQDTASMQQQIAQAEATYAAQIAEQKRQEEARKAAQIAEQKRQEEARKKAAAEAEAAKNQQHNNNNNNNGGGSSSSGGGTSTGGGGSSTGGGGSSSSGSGGYAWPVSGYTSVSSPYGWRSHPLTGRRSLHGGIDIPAPNGTPIRAAKSGVVILSTYGSSYGNYIVVAHGDGSRTLYAHQSSRAASAGETVSQGETIGYVGSTGSSTGNHLHFEVWTGSSSSSRVNPMNYY